MTMPNIRIQLKWVQKYSIKNPTLLTKGTLNYYKWAQKMGRKKFLKWNHKKNAKFIKNHPNNLNYRVFKSTILKNKNVNSELLINFRNLIENKGTAKGAKKYSKLTPKALYNKMKDINK